jgi:hypothetical protein
MPNDTENRIITIHLDDGIYYFFGCDVYHMTTTN